MGAAKFRIPNTDLYLREDGTLSPTFDNDDDILELTSEHADFLNLVYRGQAMRNIVFLSHSRSAQDDEDFGVEALKEVFEWFALGIDFFEFGEKLNNWLTGAHGGTDPVMESLQRLHQRLSNIEDFNLAAWATARGEHLASLLALSSTAIRTANEFMVKKGSRSDPYWAAKIARAEADSRNAVDTFFDTEGGYWLRPASLAAVSWAGDPTDYYRGWMPHMADRAEVNQFKQVWDYRWAQPAFLYAIAARMIVLKAFEIGLPSDRLLFCNEVKGFVKALGAVFRKRWEGLRVLETLSDLQIHGVRTRGHVQMAAVDIYGGDYIGGVFFYPTGLLPTRFPPGMAPPNLDDGDLFSEAWTGRCVKAYGRHWWNLLYLRTGLHDLFLTISELDYVCDQAWFPTAIRAVNTQLHLVKTDGDAGKAARAAVALADLVPEGDGAERAARTSLLYEAIRNGDDGVREIVANCARIPDRPPGPDAATVEAIRDRAGTKRPERRRPGPLLRGGSAPA